jgi:hypothetical protein
VTVYSFRIAYSSEEELQALQAQQNVDPNQLTLTILPDGQPSYKTLYTRAETEQEAIDKVSSYVEVTKYSEIQDKKFI